MTISVDWVDLNLPSGACYHLTAIFLYNKKAAALFFIYLFINLYIYFQHCILNFHISNLKRTSFSCNFMIFFLSSKKYITFNFSTVELNYCKCIGQVYHMPMMYGGYGNYGYNPQWGYSIPVMPSPATIEEGKQTPIMPGQICCGYHVTLPSTMCFSC